MFSNLVQENSVDDLMSDRATLSQEQVNKLYKIIFSCEDLGIQLFFADLVLFIQKQGFTVHQAENIVFEFLQNH